MIELIHADERAIPHIQAIAQKTWPVAFGEILSAEQIDYMLKMMYSTESLKKQLGVLKHHFILAKRGAHFLGFISFESPYQGKKQTKIHKIYLLPETQGTGLGRILMERVEEIAVNKNDKRLLLNVNKYNKAEHFYERLGYRVIGMETIDIGAGFLMEDKIMSKQIT